MKKLVSTIIFLNITLMSIAQKADDKKLGSLSLQAKDWLYILTVTPQVQPLKKETDSVRSKLLTSTTLASAKAVKVEPMEQGKIVSLYHLLSNQPYHEVKDYMPRLTAAFVAVSPYVAARIKYIDQVNSSTTNHKLQGNTQTLKPSRVKRN